MYEKRNKAILFTSLLNVTKCSFLIITTVLHNIDFICYISVLRVLNKLYFIKIIKYEHIYYNEIYTVLKCNIFKFYQSTLYI